MSRELRIQSSRHPFQTRLRARELFLADHSFREIAEILGKEADEVAAAAASKTGGPLPPPSPRIAPSLLHYWSRHGFWDAHRGVLQRDLQREQLGRARREMAQHMNEQFVQLREIDTFLIGNFLKVKTGSDGEPVLGGDGLPIMVPKTPEDLPIDDPIDLVRLQLRLLTVRMSYIRMVSDMIGGALPKIDIDDFSLPEAPAPPD
jgi:hypothetical protein